MPNIDRAGILVRDPRTNTLGITTDSPRKRTPNIPVQWVGAPYPVLVHIELLVREG